MAKRDAKMRAHSLYVGRLRRSRLRAAFHERIAQEAARSFPGGWIVDVGCGPGLLEPRIRSRVSGAKIIGLDMDPTMLGIARAQPVDGLVLANASALPFKSGSVALVGSTASLKDWGRPALGLKEIARVLEPGGKALVADFPTAGPGSRPRGLRKRFGLASWLLALVAGWVWPFTMEDARAITRAAEGAAALHVDLWPEIGVVRIEVRAPAPAKGL